MSRIQRVVVKYSPGLDALYVWFVPRIEARLVPVDEGLFFEYRSVEAGNQLCGYELLDLVQFVGKDDDVYLPIDEPRERFQVEGETSDPMSLSELIVWAYRRFAQPRQPARA